MRVQQARYREATGWQPVPLRELGGSANLVFVFGSTALLRSEPRISELRAAFPSSILFGCSTAGEIFGDRVDDDTLTVTAVDFEKSTARLVSASLDTRADSERAGEELSKLLLAEGLAHVLVLSDGLVVNGSELVRGLERHLPAGVAVTGGLAGDGARFAETLVLCDGEPRSSAVAAVGLYGDHLKVGYGSLGGWDPFGPERLVTRSDGNVLYELDGRSALELYKLYLGDHAAELPASGLLFPLSVRPPQGGDAVVRTIVAIDEEASSMTFVGDLPQGFYARFMKANFDRLVDGAIGAANACHQALGSSPAELALLVSCVGRKLVLKQRVEEEVEGVRQVLGREVAMTGFYSYGEISPFVPNARCELHNQTMTITTLVER